MRTQMTTIASAPIVLKPFVDVVDQRHQRRHDYRMAKVQGGVQLAETVVRAAAEVLPAFLTHRHNIAQLQAETTRTLAEIERDMARDARATQVQLAQIDKAERESQRAFAVQMRAFDLCVQGRLDGDQLVALHASNKA